jgi:hypothetical protein
VQRRKGAPGSFHAEQPELVVEFRGASAQGGDFATSILWACFYPTRISGVPIHSAGRGRRNHPHRRAVEIVLTEKPSKSSSPAVDALDSNGQFALRRIVRTEIGCRPPLWERGPNAAQISPGERSAKGKCPTLAPRSFPGLLDRLLDQRVVEETGNVRAKYCVPIRSRGGGIGGALAVVAGRIISDIFNSDIHASKNVDKDLGASYNITSEGSLALFTKATISSGSRKPIPIARP